MKQSRDRSPAEGEKEAESRGSLEAQQLHYHLGELRTTVRMTHAMRVDFAGLIQKAQLNIAATKALLQEINLLAGRLEISPLPSVKSWSVQMESKSNPEMSLPREEALSPVE